MRTRALIVVNNIKFRQPDMLLHESFTYYPKHHKPGSLY